VGAGLAGINAGILLPAKVPGINLTIFEKNADVGGTWLENIYPGVRCDIPAHVYQSTFAPNTQWSEEYAQGAEILAYWKSVAKKYSLYEKYLRLSQKITDAVWDVPKSKWTLSVRKVVAGAAGEEYSEDFDVVILALGRFNAWKLPDYPGILDYKGHLSHSSAWEPSFDPIGKTVAVIGNGASGIQLVPNLLPLVKHLDHYARSRTWIADSFGGEGAGRKLESISFSKDQLESFSDPEIYYVFRKELESKFYLRFGTLMKGSEENAKLRKESSKLMAERVSKKPELISSLIPDFSPNCRRLTPGPGYLEALSEDHVSFIQTPISHFTETSIVDTNGIERAVEAVICSTGANIDMLPPFPITGPSGTLKEAWTPDPLTYLGLASPSFPNLLFSHGPNATGHSGTVPNQIETQLVYIARLLRKISQQKIRTFSPSQEATDDFIEYSDTFFSRTVWSEKCSSWANGGKPGGRIHGHWPGSASHANFLRQSPRWEDWTWGYGKEGKLNRFEWLGNGWTKREIEGKGDMTPYLRRVGGAAGEVDLKGYHEEWFEGLE